MRGSTSSEVSDLTALVLIGRDVSTGIWSAKPTFWLPAEAWPRSRRTIVKRMIYGPSAAFLETTPGAEITYEYVAQYLHRETFAKHRVVKLAFDRWNFKHLKPWLLAAGFSEHTIAERFVEFGQGAQSMSSALRALEELVVNRKFKHGNHAILTMCCANSVVEGVDASNRKLSKKRSSGRIDGMIALAMAVGVAPLSPVKFDVEALIG